MAYYGNGNYGNYGNPGGYYGNYGASSSRSKPIINKDVQTQLEIKIKSRADYSKGKLEFVFKPEMIRASAGQSAYASSYGSSLGSYGRNASQNNAVYLPTTHLVDKIFPKYYKRYKVVLKFPAIVFLNEGEYLKYTEYANSIIYKDGASPASNMYVIPDNETEMINRNILFILNQS